MEKQNKMGVMPVPRLLFSVSLPIMISMFIQALYNIVDSMYVARISEQAFTALSMAFPLQMITMAVAVGTAVGMGSLISRRLGAGQSEKADLAAGNGLMLSLLSSFIFVLVGLFFCGVYFGAVTSAESDPMIAKHGIEYLSTVLAFSPGIFLAVSFEKQLQATGRTVLSMITQAAGAVTNIVLDPVFIFGNDVVPAMGVRGAAVATVIGQFVSAAIGLIFILTLNSAIKMRFSSLRLDKRTVADIYRVGIASIVIQTIGSVANFFMNRILVGHSDTAVAVLGAYFKLSSFVFMPLFGFNSGIIPITGFNYGARKKQRLVSTVKCAAISGVSIMAVGTALFILFPRQLLGIFEASDAMLEIGVNAFRLIALCFIPSSISIILNGVFSGLGIGKYSMISSLIRGIAVLVPAAWLLSELFGINAVWWAYPAAELIGLAASLLMYKKAYKTHIAPLPDTISEADSPIHAAV